MFANPDLTSVGLGPGGQLSSPAGVAGGALTSAVSEVPAFSEARGRSAQWDGTIQSSERERSQYTAAGRLRQPVPIPQDPSVSASMTQLLLEQNRLLVQQLQALQSQTTPSHASTSSGESSHSSRLFQEPKDLLIGVDPALRGVFESFAKDTKHTFAAWETQRSLHDKYSRLVDENKLHAHFQAEAAFKWQFAKRYIAQAQPLAPDGSGTAMTDESYDLLADWEEMRQRHAQECFAFVRIHQERCLKMYDEEVSCETLQRKLADKVVAWLAQHGYNDAGIAESMVHKSKQFVDSLVRLERPKVQNRIDKDKELKQKRDQALLDATCKWESLDVKDVLSPALLELASRGPARGKPLTVKEDSALAFLVKDNAELQEKHRIKITSSAVRVPTPKHKPKPSPRRGRATDRSPSRHRPTSILKGSRSPSKSRASSRVSFADGAKGKGKGKGKGQGKGRGKGRGRSKRK